MTRQVSLIVILFLALTGCSGEHQVRPDGLSVTAPESGIAGKDLFAGPDVTVTDFFADPPAVMPGQALNLHASLANLGDAAATQFTVRVVEQNSGRVLVRRTVAQLDAGAEVSGAAQLTVPAKELSAAVAPGIYTLVASHDYPDSVGGNDSRSVQVEVLPADFSLELTVLGPGGAPLPDLEAKLQVRIPEFDPMKPKTVIQFEVPVPARVSMTVFDLEGQFVRTMIDGVLAPGMHSIAFDGRNAAGEPLLGTWVLRYEMVGGDDTGAELFRDSKWMTLCTVPDLAQAPILGMTDQNGMVATGNRLLFPFLYDLPELIMTDENGEITGTFTISDIVTVTLKDLVSGLHQNFDLKIGPGLNQFILRPDAAPLRVSPSWDVPAGAGVHGLPSGKGMQEKLPVPDWRLLQCYPNPFN